MCTSIKNYKKVDEVFKKMIYKTKAVLDTYSLAPSCVGSPDVLETKKKSHTKTVVSTEE